MKYLTLVLLIVLVLTAGLILVQNERFYERQVEFYDKLEKLEKRVSRMDRIPGGFVYERNYDETGNRNIFPQGGTLVMQSEEPSTLNPLISNESVVNSVSRHIIENLITLDPDTFELKPKLAASYSIAEDKLSYTFTLKKNIRWSDGEPFTADDVVFTFETIMDPRVDSAHLKADLMDVDRVEKIDDHTVVFHYRNKYFGGLLRCGYDFYVLPRHYYEERIRKYAADKGIEDYSVIPGEEGFGKIFNKLRYPPIGTGPFMFPEDGWQTAERLILVRNPDYWGEGTEFAFNLDEIHWRFIRDEVTELEEMRKEKLDINVVDIDVWEDQLSKDPSITDKFNYYQYDHTGIGYSYICWNCRISPFNDVRVRRAMTHLIDRKTMLEKFHRNSGQVISCVFKTAYPEYSHDLEPLPFAPDTADKLLREAGWTDNDGDGILDKKGEAFKFELKVPSGRVEYIRWGTFIQEEMKKHGIAMTLNPLEWSVFIEDYYNRRFESISLYRGGSSPWPDPYYSWHSSQDKPRAGNAPGFRNERADELMEKARKIFDRDERVPLYHEFNRILQRHQPMTLLFTGPVNVLVHKRFENVIIHKMGIRYSDFYVLPENRLY